MPKSQFAPVESSFAQNKLSTYKFSIATDEKNQKGPGANEGTEQVQMTSIIANGFKFGG